MGRIACPAGARRVKAPIWHEGSLEGLGDPGDRPVAWHVRLDDPAIRRLASYAALRTADWRDLADRPQAAMRGLRRQLAKVLLAHLAKCHPDSIAIARDIAGSPRVLTPDGWHLSLAARWPHVLIGVARVPLGVDIEPCDALPPPNDALTPGERMDLTNGPDDLGLRRWTAKEAHAKLFGVASQVEGSQIDTQVDGAHLLVRSAHGLSVCHQTVGPQVIRAVAQRAPGP